VGVVKGLFVLVFGLVLWGRHRVMVLFGLELLFEVWDGDGDSQLDRKERKRGIPERARVLSSLLLLARVFFFSLYSRNPQDSPVVVLLFIFGRLKKMNQNRKM